MARKNALRLRSVKKFTSAGLATLRSDPVEHDKIYCFQHISWEIDTATSEGNTRCRLYIEGHGYKHSLAEQDAPVADTLYWFKEPTWLIPGERVALDIDQAQANTTAQMEISGYWTEQKEGIVT